MASENFKRRYILTCGESGSEGFSVGNIRSVDETALHICFNLEKSDSSTCNTAKLQIWNLSDTNLKILEKKDCIVELKAGYGDNTPLIFAGTITSCTTTADNADRMSELEIIDGRVALRDTAISLSLNGMVNSQEMYNRIASEMGVPIVLAEDLAYVNIPNGFSFVGKARDALNRLSDCNNHCWTIQNGVLQITNPNKPVTSVGYLLSSETGLIGTPKKIVISENAGNTEAQTGWEIVYFLNGAIGVNDIVKLKSAAVTGDFRVHKITMDGDNIDGDWICTAQVIEIK